MPRIVTLTLNPTVDKSTTSDQIIPDHKLRCTRPKFEPAGRHQRVAGPQAAGNGFGSRVSGWAAQRPAAAPAAERGRNRAAPHRNRGLDPGELYCGRYLQRSAVPLRHARGRAAARGAAAGNPGASGADGATPIPGYQRQPAPGVAPGFLVQVARAAKKLGVKVVADTSGPALLELLQEGVYLAKPNVASSAK